MHPRIPLAFLAARAHCWLMVNLSSTRTPRFLSAECFPTQFPNRTLWWSVHSASEGRSEGTHPYCSDEGLQTCRSAGGTARSWGACPESTRSKSPPGKHKRETDLLLPSPSICSRSKTQDVEIQSPLVYKNHSLTADILSSLLIIQTTLDLVQ